MSFVSGTHPLAPAIEKDRAFALSFSITRAGVRTPEWHLGRKQPVAV
jgi:hypothetical protein